MLLMRLVLTPLYECVMRVPGGRSPLAAMVVCVSINDQSTGAPATVEGGGGYFLGGGLAAVAVKGWKNGEDGYVKGRGYRG